MIIWEVFGMSLLLGWTLGIIFGGASEAHEKNKEIAQLKNDLTLAYREADEVREALHLYTLSHPSRLAKN